ncbi:Protein of unknown function [Lactobacillus helveticus CIRM-BIA 953]|uniref:Uncharacterized protein n=1 Tax=Lactobacillus helveticus CIRM-BIA 953 TaxID=1226335 RepID=U4QJ79_LACHE|nr:Protein of unknown function [Lactobacillus helveticus CIRM-BIA 953]
MVGFSLGSILNEKISTK